MPRRTKPTACLRCGASGLQPRITTYPVELTAWPSLAGKQIHVHRIVLHVCVFCGYLMPTDAGQAKIDRCVARDIEFFLGLLS